MATTSWGQRLVERKEMLARLPAQDLSCILYARYVDSCTVENPVSWLYTQVLALELEDVVGKLADSPSVPGERTKYWFKLKRPGAVPRRSVSREGVDDSGAAGQTAAIPYRCWASSARASGNAAKVK